MAIEFVCSHCSKPYRVKDELAGRTAKCGKCGERMQIPQPGKVVTKSPAAAQPAAASKTPAAAKGTAAGKTTAAPRSAATAIASGAQKTGVSRPAAAGTANGQRPKQPPPQPDQARPAATHDTVANASASSDTGSWLDDDLLAAPVQHQSPPIEIACPKCGKRQPPGGVICGGCGEMLPAEAPVSNRPVLLKPLPAKQVEPPKKTKSKRKIKFDFQLGSVGTLIRGTLLSGLFTLFGAGIWAVVAYLTMSEFAVIAWGMGGLAGLGMAIGHDDDDGTMAGIIAAFVSLFGIIAAKFLIIVVFVAAAVAGGLETNLQRELVIQDLAQQSLKQQGGNPANASEEQTEKAVAEARAQVQAMDDAQIEQKFHEMEARWEAEADAVDAQVANAEEPVGNEEAREGDAANDQPEPIVVEQAAIDPDVPQDEPGLISLFFSEMFSPIDGLFILLAFFTAYKVGSGQQSD